MRGFLDDKTNAANGADDCFRIGITEFVAHVFNVHVDKIRHGKRIEFIPPDMLGQGEAGNRPVFVIQEKLQDRKFFGRQFHAAVLLADLAGFGVQGDVPDNQHGISLFAAAPEKRADSGHQLGYGKGFGQVIIDHQNFHHALPETECFFDNRYIIPVEQKGKSHAKR